ncbi:MAG TPA: RluA family pseudouridine synthase [Candidatus Hydrogenedentes bacterium]|nr:RluA family pseudouridine synthase [Candidatus Hydrogenedentota bacterium]
MRINVKKSVTLMELLQEKLDSATKTRLKKMLKYGAVSVNGAPALAGDMLLKPGQRVDIKHLGPEDRVPAPFPVLFEDRFLIAVEKPGGLLSIATETSNQHTLYRKVYAYVQAKTQEHGRVYIVHRLDRDVSGVILLAKTLETKKKLQKEWNQTIKLYGALVEGHPPQDQDTIKTWLREENTLKVHSVPKGPGAQLAITRYRVKKAYDRYTLLEVRIDTGRKNQIRVHLSELGCPVAGDEKYGAKTNPIRRLALHAYRLVFTHPVTGERVTVESPLPKPFFLG